MRTKSQGKSCEGSNGVGERKWSSVETRIQKEEIKKDTSVFVAQIYKKAVRETKRERVKETKRLRVKETKRQKDKKTKRRRVKETKSQRDEESKRRREEERKGLREGETKGRRGEMSENEGEKRFFRKKNRERLAHFKICPYFCTAIKGTTP